MSEPVWWCPECENAVHDEWPGGEWCLVFSQERMIPHSCPGTPIDLIAEREMLLEWIRGADHHPGCSGGWKRGTNEDAEYWPCKCGRRAIVGEQ